MLRKSLAVAVIGLCFTGNLLAFDVVGTIKRVDAEKGFLEINARGRERSLPVAKDVRVLDKEGKELAGGLRSAELNVGTEVTITLERQGGGPIVKAIRLGGQPGAAPRARPGKPPVGGKSSVGFKPLTEMTAQDRYKGEDGGLYGAGRNEPPPLLEEAARRQTARIEPLDAGGKPAANGRIVLISISMSNATQEFSLFKNIADADPQKSSLVTIVDCAQGGQAMAEWADPKARAWEVAERRLADSQVSPRQVQVAWIKLANKGPRGDLQDHGKKLQQDTLAVIRNARERFPNLRIVYLSSRIYAGYANGSLNPEPYAYESAFVVRWLIQDQLKGDPARTEPLLLWGPYFWADGVTPRKSDGLVYERADLGTDGVHPSPVGRRKVADQILKFFKTDPFARTWFVRK